MKYEKLSFEDKIRCVEWTEVDPFDINTWPKTQFRCFVELKSGFKAYMVQMRHGFMSYLLYPKAKPVTMAAVKRWKYEPIPDLNELIDNKNSSVNVGGF